MRDDGTWSIWFEGPPDLSTSIEAYVACRLAGVDPGPRALAYIQREGGIPKSRLFTKCFMALLGQWPWQRMAPIPPELVLLPAGIAVLDLRLLLLGAADVRRARGRAVAASGAAVGRRPDGDRREAGTDEAAAAAERRSAAARSAVAERWIRERQEADGSWGGIQPPWVWGIIALTALGHGLDDPVLGKAVEGWQGFMVDDGERLRPEACQSPVWDTGLALLALRACGVPDDHPQLVRAGEYLLAQEVLVKGDWAIRRPDLAPGGWAFEYENVHYPDVDDTAVLPVALHGMGIGEEDAIARGLDWLVGMQSRDGGWGSFDVDNDARWLYKIPFCDFGKVTDEPTADVTAHSLEALGTLGVHRDAAERGLEWLLSEQEEDGSWFGRWGVNHIYGTGAALPGLEAVRDSARPPVDAPRRCLARLRPAGERRLRRGHPLLRRSRLARPRGVHDGVADRLGATRLRGRRKR